MDILRVKDDQGQWRDIPALVGPQGETGPQGPPGADGADGVSPTALVEQTASGATITVTDAQGTTTANLTNGQDGRDGSPGADGADGQSAYVWIRYASAQPTQDSDMKTTPDAWMGIYSGDSAIAPTAYTAYTWYNIKGQGPVSDVQVNGVSVLSDGVANIPEAVNNGDYGVVKVSSGNGIGRAANGYLYVVTATDNQVKAGTNSARPISPTNQHESTFYGLAKAAGDSTQSASSNAVGTYTDSAKSAIQHMLGTDTNLAPYESDTTADAAYAIGEMFMLNGKLHQATVAIAVGDTLAVGANCAVVNASEVFPHDVRVNGASVVTNGVANVPVGSSTLDGLSDVNVSGAEIGDSIIYLGSGWTPGAPIKNYEIEDDGNGNPCIYSLYDIVSRFTSGYFINVYDIFGTDESPNYTVTNAVSYTDGDGNPVNICELQRMKPNGKIEKRIFADRWDETLQDTVYREETPTGMVSNTITLTQAEYDALVNAGTVDQQTLYCIKESGS